ncbi:hypothetical protein ACRYI5_07160 [Furfurilactobacillus sp. WILCCON 0119]
MQRKSLMLFAAAVSALSLAGCGRTSLTTTKTTYHQNGMVAAVKGNTSAKKVTYQVDDQAKKTLTVRNGTFVIQVPSSTKNQQVKLTAGSDHKTVHVAAATALADYQTLRTSFNQALAGSQLSPADQKKAAQLQAAAASLKQQPSAQAMTTVQSLQKDVQTAMATANQQVKGQLLPTKTPSNGVHTVVSTKDYKIRMNVQDGKVMGSTMIVPTKNFKQKSGQKKFGTSFALLVNGTGADAKKVMKDFGKETRKAKKGSTNIDPIYSKGVKFTIGLSSADIYIFMTK